MRPSFSRRLTASYLFVVAVTLAFTGIYLTRRLRADFLRQLEQSLAIQASLLAQSFQADVSRAAGSSALQRRAEALGRATGGRVSVIRADGRVLADSQQKADEVPLMDNHRRRPEVEAALRLGTGEATRYSATLRTRMLYVAVPIRASEGAGVAGVLRLALPTTEVDARITAFRGDLLKAGLAALLVALAVALFSVRRISRPLQRLVAHARAIGEGRYAPAVAVESRDEFGRLAAAFSEMARRVEEKVRELSQERTQLSAILSSLVEGVLALDQEGRVVLLNPAAEGLFKVRTAQVKDRPFLEALRYGPLNDALQEALTKKEPLTKEITLHSPEERVLSVQALPIDYGEGRAGVLAALHDVTELRRLERVRQEFVANVSHELKTPLTSIKGYVETLLDGAIDDAANNRSFLQTIQEQADRLMRLIEDLLDLSAIEAKRVLYRLEAVALQGAAERVLQSLRPMASAKGVRIDNRLSEALPPVRADREKLAQILMNLVDNAVKFNQAGGRVVLSARVAGDALEVEVQDTGAGIPPEDLPRVFERFFRGDKSHSQETRGTGLGLAIVKHLVEAQGGAVEAESAPGEGSTLRFTLPLA
jgi:two-component system phosphate regulon sensor histidine kinase PhoR